MAINVSDDLTIVSTAEAVTNWSCTAGSVTLRTMFAQGANSCSFDPNGTGVKAIGYDAAAANVTVVDKHILAWVNIGSVENNTFANGGQRIRISSNLMSVGTAYGDYYCGGNDKNIAAIKGAWIRLCADVHKIFDASSSPPVLSGVRSIGAVWNVSSVPAGINALCACDQIAYGTGFTVSGGASVPRGSPEIAANDRTNGRGMFKNADGVYYVLGRVTIGDTLGNSTFEDTSKVWNFEDQAVSASFHQLEFIGGEAYTNLATFGIKSGSGKTAEASAGNTFLSGGAVPFRVKATDSNVNTVGFYGCNFIGPSGLMLDNLRAYWYVDDSISSWILQTREAGNTTAADVLFMPATEAVGDCAYYGYPERFAGLRFILSTAGTVGTCAWEYYNGSTWVALPAASTTDGTNQLRNVGTNDLTFTPPDSWAKTTLGPNPRGPFYWIRSRVTGVYTVNPVGTRIQALVGGDIELEHANAEAIRCVFAGMGTIRVRNGALLKKSVITSSHSSDKWAALDLGSTDPALDTIRDLDIKNCNNGILLGGTSSGVVDFNFRNIVFANNVNDVRVDFPAAATININVLEGGSTPTISNVNSSTINISNSVTLKVTAQSEQGATISGILVRLSPMNESTTYLLATTDANGEASTSFNFITASGLVIRARKSSPGGTRYVPVKTFGNITSTGLDMVVTMVVDTVAP